MDQPLNLDGAHPWPQQIFGCQLQRHSSLHHSNALCPRSVHWSWFCCPQHPSSHCRWASCSKFYAAVSPSTALLSNIDLWRSARRLGLSDRAEFEVMPSFGSSATPLANWCLLAKEIDHTSIWTPSWRPCCCRDTHGCPILAQLWIAEEVLAWPQSSHA